ncbi:MAG TPA: hypothetical protein VH540_22360 [Ktedonobacterales bacterium]
MAKRRRSGGKGAAPTPAEPADPTPAIKSSAVFGGLRLAALLSATVIALVVYSVLQGPLGYWPALILGLVAGVLARAVLLWAERLWLRALVRRARARQAEQSGKSV